MNGQTNDKPKSMRSVEPPAIESLSESTIRQRAVSEAVQYPATLLPLAVCAMSTTYLLLVSPILGGGFWAIALTGVSGIGAAVSFLSRYTKGYARRARELVDLLERERARLDQAELRRRRENLQAGFSNIASPQGLKALEELSGEYDHLQPALGRGRKTDPLAMSLVPALAGETYQQGLSVLSDALELMNAARAPTEERLKGEIAHLEKEVEAWKGQESHAEALRIKEETLASHRQRLHMLDQLQLRVDRLFHQAGRCEALLHRTRIELAAIRTGSSETSVDSVIEALQRTLRQVKEVQEELKRLGY